LARRQAGEGEQPLAGFFEAVCHGARLQPPFGQEQLPPAHHLGAGFGVDHVVVVGGDLLVQGIRRMRLFRQGCRLYELMPTTPKPRLGLLVRKLAATLAKPPVFAETFRAG
jgi:hypothetical protein